MREQIKAILEDNYPDIDFEASDQLVCDEILDSLTIVGIVAAISAELDIEIPFEEIKPENFNSIDAMARMVESL